MNSLLILLIRVGLYYLFASGFGKRDIFSKFTKTFEGIQKGEKKGMKEVVNLNEMGNIFSSGSTSMESLRKIIGNVGKIAAILLVLLIISSGFKIVDPGERGVKITLGKVSTIELEEGLHWKIPLIQTIKSMSIQVQKLETVSSSASKDLQSVQTDMALNYNLKPGNIVTMFQNVGDEKVIASKIIDPAIQESVKAATAQFTAEQLISKRPEVNTVMFDLLVSKLDALGVKVVAVNIVDFKFSEAFDVAIEAKVRAEQEALTEENKLEQIKFQAQQRVETARGEAESILLKAKADAEANIIVAESLTEQLVKYRGIEQRNGILPTVTSDAGLLLQGEF